MNDGTTDAATQKAFQQGNNALSLLFQPKCDIYKYIFKEICIASMQLLKRHAELIDPVCVLKILPESIVLDELLEYLQLTFSDQAHKRRRGAITKHLASAENVKVKHQLCQLKRDRTVVDQDSQCRIWYVISRQNFCAAAVI